MENGDKKRLGKLLWAMAAAYRTDLTEPLLLAFELALEDLPMTRIEAAIRRAIRQGGDFMPNPSRLRAMAGAPSAPYHVPLPPDHPAIARIPPPEQRGWPAMIEALKPEEPKR